MRRLVSALAYLIAICLLLPLSARSQTTLAKPQPRLMTDYKWAWLTPQQREIYTKGFLETTSFYLYSYSRKDDEEHAKIFSDWTACAESVPLSRWQTLDWTIRGETQKTVAAQFYDIASIVCKELVGKGDKKWRSVWLLKPAEWKSLSLHDRAIYLMAYAETVFQTARRSKNASDERKLDICLASAGIEGLLSSMEQTKIEWQFPLPWSVSRAMGATCKDK
jgi:hypothetical protein